MWSGVKNRTVNPQVPGSNPGRGAISPCSSEVFLTPFLVRRCTADFLKRNQEDDSRSNCKHGASLPEARP